MVDFSNSRGPGDSKCQKGVGPSHVHQPFANCVQARLSLGSFFHCTVRRHALCHTQPPTLLLLRSVATSPDLSEDIDILSSFE
ncbi:hypothetical protein EUGRSUZ_B04015 [Eucalyptus grandis]|uniref:Uncharacterized protein n=2 Tax=Eucalyptus grandis TaxID=71139 RepID=A0ACC3LZ07_EUCGR|nr:hypothetical protein EUGRSUZ_B04015 [Eucalyptus grandis]